MAGLHHMVLKAAVAKYAPLLLEEKTEWEIKAEMSKDEKSFTSEAIDEIYSALTKPTETDPDKADESKKENGFVVDKAFRDINDFMLVHQVGEDVSDMDPDRLKHLVELGIVKSSLNG